MSTVWFQSLRLDRLLLPRIPGKDPGSHTRRGKPQFRDLHFDPGEPCFFAFDVLMSDSKDLRTEKLTHRKQELRRLMSKVPESRMRYADHIENYGSALFSAYLRDGS